MAAGYAMAGWIALCQGESAESYLMPRRALLDDRPTPATLAFLKGADYLLMRADPRAIPLLAEARAGFMAAGPDSVATPNTPN